MPETQQLFIVQGPIQELRVSPDIAKLIFDLQTEAFVSGVFSGFAGQAGVAANSASVAMYDGEDVEHLALLINDKLVVGTFEWLRNLNVGDQVTLVVSTIDDGPLFAHAILRSNDQLLWTPFSVDHTRRGWILHAVKLGLLGLIGTWLMLGSFYILGSRPTAEVMAWTFVFSILLITFVVSMSTMGVMHLGVQAEAIFQALKVPKFEQFRIKPYSLLRMRSANDADRFRKGHIFYFADALSAHKKKFRL